MTSNIYVLYGIFCPLSLLFILAHAYYHGTYDEGSYEEKIDHAVRGLFLWTLLTSIVKTFIPGQTLEVLLVEFKIAAVTMVISAYICIFSLQEYLRLLSVKKSFDLNVAFEVELCIYHFIHMLYLHNTIFSFFICQRFFCFSCVLWLVLGGCLGLSYISRGDRSIANTKDSLKLIRSKRRS